MFFLHWNPILNFPLSGNVNQNIETKKLAKHITNMKKLLECNKLESEERLQVEEIVSFLESLHK